MNLFSFNLNLEVAALKLFVASLAGSIALDLDRLAPKRQLEGLANHVLQDLGDTLRVARDNGRHFLLQLDAEVVKVLLGLDRVYLRYLLDGLRDVERRLTLLKVV